MESAADKTVWARIKPEEKRKRKDLDGWKKVSTGLGPQLSRLY